MMGIATFHTPGTAALLLMAALGAVAEAGARGADSGKPKPATKGIQVGLASYYGGGLDGKKTASGERFDKTEMVAAHPSYPLGTRARVTNLHNGRSQEVRIIDRGPRREHQHRGVIIDVSEATARKLGFRQKGKTRVKVQVLEWGEKNGR